MLDVCMLAVQDTLRNAILQNFNIETPGINKLTLLKQNHTKRGINKRFLKLKKYQVRPFTNTIRMRCMHAHPHRHKD